jgi:hypothetical protein
MKDWHVPPSPCPWCGEDLTAASGVNHPNNPEPGDCTICIYCAGWCIFDEQLLLRKPTSEEQAEIDSIHEAQLAQAAVLEAWKETD